MTSRTLPPREWLSTKEAAAWLGLSVKTIWRAKAAGKLSPKKSGEKAGNDLYRIDDLRQWVESLKDS